MKAFSYIRSFDQEDYSFKKNFPTLLLRRQLQVRQTYTQVIEVAARRQASETPGA